MGWRNIFGSDTKNDKPELPWISLQSIDQLDGLSLNSKSRTQLIFKHSTTCGISRMVLNRFTSVFPQDFSGDLYFLDLHRYRAVSDAVANTFRVIHQSPQLLIIKDGAVVAHASHGEISTIDLMQFS